MNYFELLTNNFANQQTRLLSDDVFAFALRLYTLSLLCLQAVVGGNTTVNSSNS